MANILEEKTKSLINRLDGVPTNTKLACDQQPVNNLDQACVLIASVFCLYPKAMKPSNKKRVLDYAKFAMKLNNISEELNKSTSKSPSKSSK